MKRDHGFTLLEVMVATAILASGLAAIIAAVGMAVRSAALATGYEEARLLAETQLASFLAERPERADSREGQEGAMNWNLSARSDAMLKGLLHVKISVRFYAPGGERDLVLETRETLRSLSKT